MQLATSKSIVKKGFKIAHIRDAYDQAQALRECADNPFLEMEIESKASRTRTILKPFFCTSASFRISLLNASFKPL